MAALFTPKKMEVMLKNHLGSLEIAEELGISPESLDLELHKIYTSSKSFGDIQRRIRSNDKKSRKNSVKHPKFDDATSKSNHSITVNESDTLDTKTISTSETLDDVLSLIEKKQADLTNIERKHQAAVTKRTNLRNRLLNSKDELLKLQDRVSVIQSRINETDVEQLFRLIKVYCKTAEIQQHAITHIRDIKDVYLLSLSQTIKADYIITGDNDLIVLEKYKNTQIVTPAQFKSVL